MEAKLKEIRKKLQLKTHKELQNYIINNWLLIADSEKIEHKITALKELGKYSFTSANHFSAPCSDVFEKDF